MKNQFTLGIIILLFFTSCSKEILNDCDKNSSAYKEAKASFTSTVSGLVVSFTNTSVNADSYQWDFGDGSVSTLQNPTKTLIAEKQYNVTLTAIRCGGDQRSVSPSQTFNLKCPVVTPTITASSKTTFCQGDSVRLTTSCANSTVLWSNSATTNTITVKNSGTYFAQCNNVCLSSKSNSVEIVVSPKPTPPIPIGASICSGTSATISASCATGNVVWYNSVTSTTGTTANTFTTPVYTNPNTSVAIASYYPACESGSCVSDRVKVDVRVNPKPTAPTITPANPINICYGSTTLLTASGCNGGIINWSNGKSGTTISESIISNLNLTATCTQSSCESPNSNVASVKVIPLAEVKSEPSPATGATSRWVIKLNGSINFNTPLSDGSVSDHGFYYIAGTVTSLNQNTAGVILVSRGAKNESIGTTFNYTFPTLQASNVFSFVAFVKDCKGETKYGQILKTN
jgi:hypothetical protein